MFSLQVKEVEALGPRCALIWVEPRGEPELFATQLSQSFWVDKYDIIEEYQEFCFPGAHNGIFKLHIFT